MLITSCILKSFAQIHLYPGVQPAVHILRRELSDVGFVTWLLLVSRKIRQCHVTNPFGR